ncbi:hypothetical protein DXZ75_05035 [Streptomyces sp. AcE210]|nr:hypothetical protein DXZ75_05035 [Streptomyces sp. AcE210]
MRVVVAAMLFAMTSWLVSWLPRSSSEDRWCSYQASWWAQRRVLFHSPFGVRSKVSADGRVRQEPWG